MWKVMCRMIPSSAYNTGYLEQQEQPKEHIQHTEL